MDRMRPVSLRWEERRETDKEMWGRQEGSWQSNRIVLVSIKQWEARIRVARRSSWGGTGICPWTCKSSFVTLFHSQGARGEAHQIQNLWHQGHGSVAFGLCNNYSSLRSLLLYLPPLHSVFWLPFSYPSLQFSLFPILFLRFPSNPSVVGRPWGEPQWLPPGIHAFVWFSQLQVGPVTCFSPIEHSEGVGLSLWLHI